ncbi:hypothetical protein LOAG_17013 [Loa loa]|uniref:Uncharacterized protein n=1 Tax=Loa loa TaxID=7209 RepID=A0A1S0UJR1_LOALO|nr:hypothetical protein LOAG_17013 [Loa loa]EJD75930.1 hypothetical protein LOAG_17013 [Loa loa]
MMFTVTGTFSSSSSKPSTAKYRAQKLERFGDVIDGTKEVNNSSTPNSTLTTVQQPVDKTATLAASTAVISSDLSGNVEGSSKSVHGIVASLIQAAEETRFKAPDKPKSLNLTNKKLQQPTTTATIIATSEQQETGTQTSPYSLSRSSSFDWLNESSIEDQYSEELIITTTESPRFPEDPEYSSLNQIAESSHTVDKEIQRMSRKSTEICGSLLEERKIQSSESIDESIAMLLEYAEDLDVVPNRELHYPVTSGNLAKLTNDIRHSESILSHEIPSDISRNRISSTKNQNEFFRRFTSTTGNGNGSGTTGLTTQRKGSSQGSMNGSIYDNVPHGIKQTATLQASLSGNVSSTAITAATASLQLSRKDNNVADSTSPSTKVDHDVILFHDPKVMDNLASPNDSAISQRDISVSSGLADSESSPMTPGAPAAISLCHSSRYKKQQPNADKNKSHLAQIEIDSSSFEMDTIGREVRSPPPPSPRLDTENRALSVVVASDLFDFSAGRVPERAESCEELNVDFTEQTSNELYTQKKQKAGKLGFLVRCLFMRDIDFAVI